MTYHQKLKQFFARPGIDRLGICKESKVSYRHLSRVLADESNLTDKFYNRLLPTLINYGYRN